MSKEKPLITPEAEQLFQDLKKDGYSMLIGKKEYAKIIGCSLTSIDNYMKRGYGCPNYKKLGSMQNAKVLFNLRDVANFLANLTVKTA